MRFKRDDAVVDSFRRLWSRSVVGATGAHVPDPQAVVDAIDGTDDEVQHVLAREITLAAIEVRSHDLWTMHAAGLADPTTGAVLALVAPSGTGKSTAAHHLGRRWAYLSDETVGVGPDGTVLAHAKPISRVVEDSDLKRQVGADEAGLLSAPGPFRLAGVVLLERDGRASALIEEVPRAEAIARVAVETSYLARLPEPLHYLDQALDSAAGVWRVTYGDLSGLEDVVDDLFARTIAKAGENVAPPAPARAADEPQPTADPSPLELTVLSDDEVRALPAIDVLDVDDERLVLLGERVVLLTPVAAAIHRHLDGGAPLTRAELLRRLGEEMPLPDEPDVALAQLLDQLAAESVVQLGTGSRLD